MWRGMVRCGAVRCGAVRCGAVRCGEVRYRTARCGAVWCAGLPNPYPIQLACLAQPNPTHISSSRPNTHPITTPRAVPFIKFYPIPNRPFPDRPVASHRIPPNPTAPPTQRHVEPPHITPHITHHISHHTYRITSHHTTPHLTSPHQARPGRSAPHTPHHTTPPRPALPRHRTTPYYTAPGLGWFDRARVGLIRPAHR